MSESSERTGSAGDGERVVLSEAELFRLATGETVTVELPGRQCPGTVTLSVTPPVPLTERD